MRNGQGRQTTAFDGAVNREKLNAIARILESDVGAFGTEASPVATVPGPKISPLAVVSRRLRTSGRLRRVPLFGLVVHTTGSGPATRERKSRGRRRAIEYALDYYIGGGGGYPHYVIDYDGTIHACSDERREAWHAGWKRDWFAPPWKPPAWWSRVWSRFNARTPLDLIPRGAFSPNSAHLGVELLGRERPGFTDAQYAALARLVVDVRRRNRLSITAAPSPQLLGHEDVNPLSSTNGTGGRADRLGGWDPGAHRAGTPYFSWERLWADVQSVEGTAREAIV
jgi:hypothetical protein